MADERPNILVVLTDQQNATMLGCAGNPYASTPALDDLAAEGVRFEHAYCTNPVCVPSRFSLLTGLMPSAVGMVSNRTAGMAPIPEEIRRAGIGFELRGAGYDAFYAGKVHLPLMTEADLGFDTICADQRDGLAEACADFLGRPRRRPFCLVASFINPHDICYMAIRDFAATPMEKALVRSGGVECACLDAALARPDGVSGDAFFAALCPPAPPNFEPQEDEPEAVRLMLEGRPFRMKARQEWSERRWREHRWAYARLTASVDRQIGRVLDALREGPENGRTAVVFTSDHGDMDASHRMEHKSTLYDEACRVPLIVRPPGGLPTGRVDGVSLVSNGLDIRPTLRDWAGLSGGRATPGRSFRPLVEGSADGRRDAVPVECAIGRGIVTRSHKYALYDIGASAEQVNDRDRDPHEQRNALRDPRCRAALPGLRELFRREFGDRPRSPDSVRAALTDA